MIKLSKTAIAISLFIFLNISCLGYTQAVDVLPEIKIQLGHSNGVISVAFSPDGKYALSGSNDTTIKLWNVKTGELVCSAIATPDGKDYLVWTPENFFAGTEWAMKNLVYIVDGNKIISIDPFYNIFYRPDLVAAKLQGKDISAEAKKIDLAKLIQGK
jgi:WD40 repeat protein